MKLSFLHFLIILNKTQVIFWIQWWFVIPLTRCNTRYLETISRLWGRRVVFVSGVMISCECRKMFGILLPTPSKKVNCVSKCGWILFAACVQERMQAMELWQTTAQELDRLQQVYQKTISEGQIHDSQRQQLKVQYSEMKMQSQKLIRTITFHR